MPPNIRREILSRLPNGVLIRLLEQAGEEKGRRQASREELLAQAEAAVPDADLDWAEVEGAHKHVFLWRFVGSPNLRSATLESVRRWAAAQGLGEAVQRYGHWSAAPGDRGPVLIDVREPDSLLLKYVENRRIRWLNREVGRIETATLRYPVGVVVHWPDRAIQVRLNGYSDAGVFSAAQRRQYGETARRYLQAARQLLGLDPCRAVRLGPVLTELLRQTPPGVRFPLAQITIGGARAIFRAEPGKNFLDHPLFDRHRFEQLGAAVTLQRVITLWDPAEASDVTLRVKLDAHDQSLYFYGYAQDADLNHIVAQVMACAQE